MNTKTLRERLINNWPVKAICFILASMIYFFHQISLLETKTFSVPLEVRKEGNMLPVSGLEKEKYIKVKIRTKREVIPLISDKDFTAYVDISSRTKEGSYNFPVCIDASEKLVQMDLDPLEIILVPDNIRFDIKKKAIKQVPVKAKVFGTPAHGYKALSLQVEPSHVFITGPQDMLDEITEFPAGSVNIENSEFNVSRILKVVNPNAYVSIFDDPLVKVSVPIVAEGMVKELENVEIKFNSLSEKFEVIDEVKMTNLVIEGSVLDIEKFRMKNLSVYSDLSFITEPGDYTVPVMVELSPAYSLVENSVPEVSVRVVHKQSENSENKVSVEKTEGLNQVPAGERQQ